MRKEYDREGPDSDYDGTRGGRPVLYAGVTWAFPTLTPESGHEGFDVVLHTGSDPDIEANRVGVIRHLKDTTAVDAALKIPSKKSGTASVNASVRAVFRFGPGPWATSGATATQGNQTFVIPGITSTAAVAAPTATGLVIGGSGTTIALAKADATNAGGLVSGAQDIPGGGAKTFNSNVVLASGAGLSLTFSDGTVQTTAATAGSAITSLTGDVTATGPGAAAATIPNNTVTNAKLADMATLTVKANITGGTTDPADVGLSAFGTAIGPFVTVTGIPPTSVTFSPGDALMFGAGCDGDLSSGFGSVHLQSPSFGTSRTSDPSGDKYYRNVTLGAGDKIWLVGGCRMFVSGTLDISAADSNAIAINAVQVINGSGGGGAAATAGSGATNGTGGNGFGDNGGPLLNAGTGGQGGGGGTFNGSANSQGSAPSKFNGGKGGTGGLGGNGSVGTGGSLVSASTRAPQSAHIPGQNIGITIAGSTPIRCGGGGGGSGGSGGGGDNAGHSGGGGGGGGAGGGVVCIFAATIARGTNTNTGIISARGGDGAAGGNGSVLGVGTGGGGGGAGGAGGWIMLGYKTLTGSTIANAIDYSGGAGGNGGNGNGTGTGGNGGDSGSSGLFVLFDMNAGTPSFVNPATGTTGGAHSGTTGGTGASANVQRNNL